MKSIIFTTVHHFTVLLIISSQTCIAGQTNQPVRPQKLPTVKTNFVAEGQLSAAEVKQVLELAKKLGIANPVEVSTHDVMPGGGRYVWVKSADRSEGRSTWYDAATIYKDSWTYAEAGKSAIQLGDFWADKNAKNTTLLRRYEFNKETIQIAIRSGVDIAFADKVIPLILSKTVQFENDWARQEFEKLKDAKPAVIYKSDSGEGYELRFEKAMIIVGFKIKKEKVVITGVSNYWI